MEHRFEADKRSVLVVVDMQPGFVNDPKDPLIEAVRGEVCKATVFGSWILLVEYHTRPACRCSYGQTFECLQPDYPYLGVVTKNDDDGSDAIRIALMKRKIIPTEFYICGVNTPYCVKSTAVGLAWKFNVYVKVIDGACGNYANIGTHYDGIQQIRRVAKKDLPNLHICDGM